MGAQVIVPSGRDKCLLGSRKIEKVCRTIQSVDRDGRTTLLLRISLFKSGHCTPLLSPIGAVLSVFYRFQGGRFDVPDRAFHSMQQTWLLSSSLSSSDVKELIPG